MFFKKYIPLVACLPLMVSCSSSDLYQNQAVEEAQVTDRTRAGTMLAELPLPSEKIPVSVYDFQDLTGQFKNNDKFTDYSSAVTKGGHAILTKALMDAGNKKWFTVVERNGLKDLLQERNIIDVMRNQYRAADGSKLPTLPPLMYGGLMIEGGIVSYDSNVITGGVGATYLGVGTNVKYNRDMVTVSLRAISVQTGEVLVAVTSSKTVFSTSVDSNLLKYVTFDRLLDAEAGFSVNEPVQLAVRQAIETGVYSLIMEGAMDKVWDFKDPSSGNAAIHQYLVRRDGNDNAMQLADASVTAAQAPSAGPAPAAAAPTTAAAPTPIGTMNTAQAQNMPPELAETVMKPATPAAPASDNVVAALKSSDAAAMAPAAGSQPAPAQPQPQPQPAAQPAADSLPDSAYAHRRLPLPSEDADYMNAAPARH